MNKELKIRKIYSLFYVILIGAIGSGVWDLFLKNLIYQAGEVLVKIASSFHQGYSDRLYENVGIQFDKLLHLPSFAIIAFIIIFPLCAYFYLTNIINRARAAVEEKNDKSEINKFEMFIFNQIIEHPTRFKIALIIPLLLSSLPYIDLLIVSSTNNRATSAVERRLDIVRPYISQIKYYELISSFRLVENRNNLQQLINQIDQIANEQNVKLPELKLYGISSSNNSSK